MDAISSHNSETAQEKTMILCFNLAFKLRNAISQQQDITQL